MHDRWSNRNVPHVSEIVQFFSRFYCKVPPFYNSLLKSTSFSLFSKFFSPSFISLSKEICPLSFSFSLPTDRSRLLHPLPFSHLFITWEGFGLARHTLILELVENVDCDVFLRIFIESYGNVLYILQASFFTPYILIEFLSPSFPIDDIRALIQFLEKEAVIKRSFYFHTNSLFPLSLLIRKKMVPFLPGVPPPPSLVYPSELKESFVFFKGLFRSNFYTNIVLPEHFFYLDLLFPSECFDKGNCLEQDNRREYIPSCIRLPWEKEFQNFAAWLEKTSFYWPLCKSHSHASCQLNVNGFTNFISFIRNDPSIYYSFLQNFMGKQTPLDHIEFLQFTFYLHLDSSDDPRLKFLTDPFLQSRFVFVRIFHEELLYPKLRTPNLFRQKTLIKILHKHPYFFRVSVNIHISVFHRFLKWIYYLFTDDELLLVLYTSLLPDIGYRPLRLYERYNFIEQKWDRSTWKCDSSFLLFKQKIRSLKKTLSFPSYQSSPIQSKKELLFYLSQPIRRKKNICHLSPTNFPSKKVDFQTFITRDLKYVMKSLKSCWKNSRCFRDKSLRTIKKDASSYSKLSYVENDDKIYHVLLIFEGFGMPFLSSVSFRSLLEDLLHINVPTRHLKTKDHKEKEEHDFWGEFPFFMGSKSHGFLLCELKIVKSCYNNSKSKFWFLLKKMKKLFPISIKILHINHRVLSSSFAIRFKSFLSHFTSPNNYKTSLLESHSSFLFSSLYYSLAFPNLKEQYLFSKKAMISDYIGISFCYFFIVKKEAFRPYLEMNYQENSLHVDSPKAFRDMIFSFIQSNPWVEEFAFYRFSLVKEEVKNNEYVIIELFSRSMEKIPPLFLFGKHLYGYPFSSLNFSRPSLNVSFFGFPLWSSSLLSQKLVFRSCIERYASLFFSLQNPSNLSKSLEENPLLSPLKLDKKVYFHFSNLSSFWEHIVFIGLFQFWNDFIKK